MTATELPYRPCVGIVLINAWGEIFTGKRLDSKADAWQMPQGGIDEGERPRQAALRELWEETGVSVDLVEFIAKTKDWVTYDLPPEFLGKVWGGKYRGQRQIWFLFRFLGSDDKIRINSEHPEFSSWRWMVADDLIASIVPFKRAVYKQVFEEFRYYLA